jgi:hypothetical protein
VRAQRDDIRFLPQTVTAAQRKKAADAAKTAAARTKTAKVVKKEAKKQARRNQKAPPDLIGFKNLPKKQQEAFAKAFEQSQKRFEANNTQARKAVSQNLQQRLARRNARMAKRLAKLQGLDDKQKKALAQAFAMAAIKGRAEMVKGLPVSRKSNLANRPTAEGEAAKAESSIVQEIANVSPDFRKNLRKLGIRVK